MVRLKDIAEITGFSITTVSRILNNDSSLSTSLETKMRVMEAAKKINLLLSQLIKITHLILF